jgi:hypothetical protein
VVHCAVQAALHGALCTALMDSLVHSTSIPHPLPCRPASPCSSSLLSSSSPLPPVLLAPAGPALARGPAPALGGLPASRVEVEQLPLTVTQLLSDPLQLRSHLDDPLGPGQLDHDGLGHLPVERLLEPLQEVELEVIQWVLAAVTLVSLHNVVRHPAAGFLRVALTGLGALRPPGPSPRSAFRHSLLAVSAVHPESANYGPAGLSYVGLLRLPGSVVQPVLLLLGLGLLLLLLLGLGLLLLLLLGLGPAQNGRTPRQNAT